MICSYRVGIFTPNECEKHYLFLPKEERILLTSWSLTNKDVNLRTLLCRIECALSDNKTIALRRYIYNQLRRNEMCKKIQYTCTLRTKTVNCHIFIIRYHHNFFLEMLFKWRFKNDYINRPKGVFIYYHIQNAPWVLCNGWWSCI